MKEGERKQESKLGEKKYERILSLNTQLIHAGFNKSKLSFTESE